MNRSVKYAVGQHLTDKIISKISNALNYMAVMDDHSGYPTLVEIWGQLSSRRILLGTLLVKLRQVLLPHGDKLFCRAGMYTNGGVEVRFSSAHFYGNGYTLNNLSCRISHHMGPENFIGLYMDN